VHKRINQVQLDIGTKKKLYQADKPIYVTSKHRIRSVPARRAESVGAQLRCFQKAIDYDPYHKRVKVLDPPPKPITKSAVRSSFSPRRAFDGLAGVPHRGGQQTRSRSSAWLSR
jgi:hypothetical protein